MSYEDLKAIPVSSWAADDCVMAMWCTLPKLEEGLGLMTAYGFQYKSALPWLKNSPKSQDLATGIGIWFMACAELVLFGIRGNVGGFYKVTKDKNGKPHPHRIRAAHLGCLEGDREDPMFWQRLSERSVISPKARKHSQKPVLLQEYLESFPGPFLELFSRRERLNWVTWGFDTGYELGPFGVREAVKEALW